MTSKARSPEMLRAHAVLAQAVASKKIARAAAHPCAQCGDRAEHWHHYLGYAPEHWLDVIALCVGCHEREHFRLKKERKP